MGRYIRKQIYYWAKDQRILHFAWEYVFENKAISGQRISVHYILPRNMYLKTKLLLDKNLRILHIAWAYVFENKAITGRKNLCILHIA